MASQQQNQSEQQQQEEEQFQSCYNCRQSFTIEQMKIHAPNCTTVVDDSGNKSELNNMQRKQGQETSSLSNSTGGSKKR